MANWRPDIIGYTWTSAVPPGQTVRYSLRPEQVGYDTVSPAYLCVANGKFDSLVDIYIDNRQITTGYYSNAAYRLVDNLTAFVTNNHDSEDLPITIIDHKHAAAFLERYVSFPAPEQKDPPPPPPEDEWILVNPLRHDINQNFGTGAGLTGPNFYTNDPLNFGGIVPIADTQLNIAFFQGPNSPVSFPAYIDKGIHFRPHNTSTNQRQFTIPQIQPTKRYFKIGFWLGIGGGLVAGVNHTVIDIENPNNLLKQRFLGQTIQTGSTIGFRFASSGAGSMSQTVDYPAPYSKAGSTMRTLWNYELQWLEWDFDFFRNDFKFSANGNTIFSMTDDYFLPIMPAIRISTGAVNARCDIFMADIRAAQSNKPLEAWVSQPTEYFYPES